MVPILTITDLYKSYLSSSAMIHEPCGKGCGTDVPFMLSFPLTLIPMFIFKQPVSKFTESSICSILLVVLSTTVFILFSVFFSAKICLITQLLLFL